VGQAVLWSLTDRSGGPACRAVSPPCGWAGRVVTTPIARAGLRPAVAIGKRRRPTARRR